MAGRISQASLRAAVRALAGQPVVVVGDPVLDSYVYGTTLRISREAPVPIVREDSREHRLGGAANAAANLAAIGARAALVGLVGDDEGGRDLSALARSRGIDTAGLLATSEGCTVTKTRVLAGGLHTTKQQLLRVDRENAEPPGAQARARLTAAARAALQDARALIVSDYGGPDMTATYVDIAREAAAARKVVVVDSRYTLGRYAGVTAVTPNEPEAEAALGLTLRTPEDAALAAVRMRETLGLEVALLTRGREGMAIARREGPAILLPVHGAPDAVDVTGAGDTVTATFATALAAGIPPLEAAVLANCAASIVVQYVGAATCSPDQLAETLAALDSAALAAAGLELVP